MSYVIYKEGTISRRSGDPTDPKPDAPMPDWSTPVAPEDDAMWHRPTHTPEPAEWRAIDPDYPGYEVSDVKTFRSHAQWGAAARSGRQQPPRRVQPFLHSRVHLAVRLRHRSGSYRVVSVPWCFAQAFPEVAYAGGDGSTINMEVA